MPRWQSSKLNTLVSIDFQVLDLDSFSLVRYMSAPAESEA
jgi:hypothetical protein